MATPTNRLRVACFDVFDTVLTRSTGSPLSAFLLLGQRLHAEKLIECSPEVFYRLRISAEARARQSRVSGEVTLHDIYRELAQSLDLSQAAAQLLAEKELQTERDIIRPVPRSIALIKESRARSLPVAFVSDMYLPSAYLKDLLEKCGAFEEGDRIFVSCEHGASKRSGELFQKVADAFGTSVSRLEHYGNDQDSDIAPPRALGARAVRCPDCDLTPYERIIEQHSLMTAGAASLIAGTSRQARLRLQESGRYDSPLHDVATGVTAPFIVAYVAWVLRQARRAGLQTLYFVSRDGQIMLEVAKRLAKRIPTDCELKYLYGSRQAWHLPGLAEISPADFDWIFEQRVTLTAEMVLKRLHISPGEAIAILEKAGMPRERCGRELSVADRSLLQQLLSPGKPLAELVLAKARTQRQILVRYLEQEGLFCRRDWGLVEIGWRGRLQRSLERTLKSAGATAPTGFYVGLFRGEREQPTTNMRAYLFDRNESGGWGAPPPAVAYIAETFCQATHGMVTGYEQANDRIVPITNELPTAIRMQWGVPAVHDAVLEFVDALPATAHSHIETADFRPMIACLFDEFWHRPSANEAARWGAFPYEDDQAGTFRVTLAQKRTLVDAALFTLTGRLPGNELSWPAASAIIAPLHVRFAFDIARRLRRVLRPLRRFVTRVMTPTPNKAEIARAS